LESKSEKLESENTKLEQENNYPKFQIEQFKRAMYGFKKERFIASENPEQLSIPFEIDEKEVAQAVESVKEQISYERKTASKKHQGPMALSSHVALKEIILEPTENVEGMKCIGQEITDELEYAHAKLFINRYIRNKYVITADEKGNQQLKIAFLDFRPIPKCIAGTHILTQIITDKFVDHLPLYRQIQRFSREGVDIPSSTVDSWIRLVSQLLQPLDESQRQHTLKNGYLQADESPIKVQDTDKKSTTHTEFMWMYHAPIPKSVYFDYRKGRGSDRPLEMLNDFEGHPQTDGYGVYPQFALKENVTQIACRAHARRYFVKALDYNQAIASHVMLLRIKCKSCGEI
jgi:transposase